MSELVTLDRRHPDFMKYLKGGYVDGKRALPVKSLNVRSDSETVTFKMIPPGEIVRPSWPVVWLKALRPRSFLQVLVPMFLVLASSGAFEMSADPDLPWLATVGVLALHAAALLRNDVQDHLSGFDRVRVDRGSRALQNGWLTVAQLEAASWIFLGIAGLCALPVVFVHPSVLVVIALTVVLGAAGFFREEKSFRDLKAGHLLIFLLGGPLLMAGYSLALTGRLPVEILVSGVVWGWLILFPVHLRDLENLIVEGQSGRASLIGRAGFDRSLTILRFWWLIGLAGFVVVTRLATQPLILRLIVLVLVLLSGRFAWTLSRLKSPAGSEVSALRKRGEFLFLFLVMIWVLESLWRMKP